MVKKLMSLLDYSLFAELALTIFAAVFVAVVIRTLLTKKEITERQARIVLGDNETAVKETP